MLHHAGLLAEHKDLTLQIFDLENSRLSSQLELLELSSREADLRQQSFKGLLVEKSNGNSDDDQTPSEEVKRKRCQLQAEEKKLNQMRYYAVYVLLHGTWSQYVS